MLSIEPTQLRAGLTWTWSRSFADYPAPTWALKYWLKNADAHIDVTAGASGSDHLVNIVAADTRAFAAGCYDWIATVESGADVFQVGSGRIEVLPRIDTAGVLDGRSGARRILEQLEAAYEAYSAGGVHVAQYTIGDRTMQFKEAGDFIKAIEYWRGRVAQEDATAQIAAGLGNPRRVFVRF